ncbi:transcription initiation factor, partial [Martensiomyces pterosporus]
SRILSKRKIQELVGEIDPTERLEPEVEDILCDIADEFIESVTSFACQLAKHRKSDTLEAKDLQLHLERNWNIRIPGFASEEIR